MRPTAATKLQNWMSSREAVHLLAPLNSCEQPVSAQTLPLLQFTGCCAYAKGQYANAGRDERVRSHLQPADTIRLASVRAGAITAGSAPGCSC